MRILFHRLKFGETYKIISPSRLLHEKFGQDLDIKIEGPAGIILGNNFMHRKEEMCRFYVSRLHEIPHSYGEVYLGRIGFNYCLINVSEVDTAGKEVELNGE
jgi:hypothetical protein